MKYFYAFVIGFALCAMLDMAWQRARGAELAIPRKPAQITKPFAAPKSFSAPATPSLPLTQTGRFPASEPCLAEGVKPSPGQTLQADQTCPTGMRWRYTR